MAQLAKESDTQAIRHGFKPDRTIKICLKIKFITDLI